MSVRPDLLVFSSEYPPHLLGGLGTHVQYMTAALREWFAVQVFVPQREGYLCRDGIGLEQIPVAAPPDSVEFWLEYAHGAALRASLAARGPAVLQCHDWSTALAGVAARRRRCEPLVFNVHLPQRDERSRAMEDLGLMAADLVIVNSHAVLEEVWERGLPLRRVEVVPNGVDLEVFRPAATWPAHDNSVLFVGRLVPQKGVGILLRAFAVLQQRLPCKLIVAGDGPLELYLLRLARSSGVPDRVSFRHWTGGAALVELYQNAGVVAVPSIYEPFGIVALEAMACGRAPVVSNTGGLPEIVTHGYDGYLVKPGDYLDLARRLLALLNDPASARRMGEAARRKAGRYSWNSVALTTSNRFREARYSGEGWSDSPPARKAFDVLYQSFDDAHRVLLTEIMGTGVAA